MVGLGMMYHEVHCDLVTIKPISGMNKLIMVLLTWEARSMELGS